MKKFLSLVLLAAILIQGCKSGADEALTDILLNESLAHISKLATAPGDSDEAQFQRLTETLCRTRYAEDGTATTDLPGWDRRVVSRGTGSRRNSL